MNNKTNLLKKYGGPDPAELHSFEKHWPSILPVVTKLIHNKVSLINLAEWQNLFHDVHMICSWDLKGCYKILESLELELKEAFIFKAKFRLANISDPQQKLREYVDSWCQYSELLTNFPLAFQQLDLAAKDIIPLPPLTECESPDSSLSSWLKSEKKKFGAVSCVLLYNWNLHIVKPFVKQLEASPTNGNNQESRLPELLANYCDLLLRRNTFSRKLTAEDIKLHFIGVSNILKFTDDKETFLKAYRHHLIRRLILDLTIDLDIEEWFANNLKAIEGMPSEPIYRFFRMIKDTKTSENVQSQFRKSIEHRENINNNNCTRINDNNNVDCRDQISNELVNIKVLNPSAWTKQDEKPNVFIDEKFKSITSNYESFYCDMYEGRQLNWCNQLSNGVVAFKSSKGEYDLMVSSSQLAVLSTFNAQPQARLNLENLAALSSLNPTELKRTIWSLISNPKLESQVIICDPKPMSLKDLDEDVVKFYVNHDFVLIKNGKLQNRGRLNLIGRVPIT